MRLFLRAHRDGLALGLAPGACLLDDHAAAREHGLLAHDLVVDRAAHEAERVDVLELGARPELLLSDGPYRDVRVAAERALLEVPVVHPDEHQDVAQLPEIRLGFFRAADVGLADDLDEWRTATVVINERVRSAADAVQVLRGVFFDVDARDADRLLLPRELDLELAVLVHRELELADLITLRQIGIEVVLARESALGADGAAEREARGDGHVDRFAVRHRERTRQTETDGARLRVRQRAEGGGAAAEELRLRADLRVDFESDDGCVRDRHGLLRIRRRKGEADPRGRRPPRARRPHGRASLRRTAPR